MKNFKLFKKAALLLAVLSLSVVLVIGTLAIAAAEGESADGYGEKYYGVRVSTDGDVNVKFYYSDLGAAAEMIAEVDGESFTYANNENLKTTVNGVEVYCINVPLRANQMASKVVVYANGAEGKKESKSISVQEYVESALKIEANAEYYDALRALANWGAMAQTYFANGEVGALPNENLFARGTNPVNGVTSVNVDKDTVKATGNFLIDGKPDGSAYVDLSAGDVKINFYVNYAGTAPLNATIFRGGQELSKVSDLEKTDRGYKVTVNNVGVKLYGEQYEIVVSDGTDTCTIKFGMLNYISKVLENKDASAAWKNVAKSMYQFYQAATVDTGADTCEHGNATNVYWVPAGENGAYVKCSFCLKTMGHNVIDNSVNTYASANTLQYAPPTGSVDATWMEEDGTQFVRFENFYAGRENFGDIDISSTFAGKEGVSGQYLVIKYRVGEEGNGTTRIEVYANTNKGSITGLTPEGQANFPKENDNEWNTVVIDLANRVFDPDIAFVDEEDGTYNVRRMFLRLFGGGSTVTDDSAEGRYTYNYTDEKGGKHTYYGTKLTDQEMEEKGYTLASISKQSVSATAYVDLSYVALCNSLDEAKTLIDTDEYEWSMTDTLSAYRKTADDSCARHQEAVTPVAGDDATVYTAACQACGEVFATQTVPNDVNYFADYSGMGTWIGSIVKNQVEDGVIFNRFTQTSGNYVKITNSSGTYGSATSSQYTTGKYVTFKYRWVDSKSYIQVNLATGDKKSSGTTGALSGELRTAEAVQNEWRVVIADVSGNAQWTSDGSKQQIYAMFLAGTGTLDIAYFAVVDSYAEAASLMGANDKNMYDYGTSFNSTTTPIVRNNKGECPHTVSVTSAEDDTAKTYTAACQKCGEVLATQTVPNTVNYFADYSGMGRWNGSFAKNQFEDGVIFNRFTQTSANYLRITNSSGTYGSATTSQYKTGKYVTFKYRWVDSASYIVVNLATGDKYTSGTLGPSSGELRTTEAVQNEWRVVIAEVSGNSKWTSDGTEQQIYATFTVGKGTLDIAYFAVVDSYEEAASLMGADDQYMYDYGTNFNSANKTPTKRDNVDGSVVTD